MTPQHSESRVKVQVSHIPSLPPRGGSWVPGGSRLLLGLAGRQCGHVGGWFGLARTPLPGGTGCSHPYGKKQRFTVSSSPLIPSSLMGSSWDKLMRAPRENYRQGTHVPFWMSTRHRYHLPVFWLRHLLFLVELLQFLVFLSQVLLREDRKSQTWAMIHLKIWGKTQARYGGQSPFPVFPLFSPRDRIVLFSLLD